MASSSQRMDHADDYIHARNQLELCKRYIIIDFMPYESWDIWESYDSLEEAQAAYAAHVGRYADGKGAAMLVDLLQKFPEHSVVSKEVKVNIDGKCTIIYRMTGTTNVNEIKDRIFLSSEFLEAVEHLSLDMVTYNAETSTYTVNTQKERFLKITVEGQLFVQILVPTYSTKQEIIGLVEQDPGVANIIDKESCLELKVSARGIIYEVDITTTSRLIEKYGG